MKRQRQAVSSSLIMAISSMLLSLVLISAPAQANSDCADLLNFEGQKLRSIETINFCKQFAGKPLLVVNTASQCGYTPQFKLLEELYQAYSDKIEIVGFPSNSFKQEYAESKKTAEVCYKNFGVTFTMMETSPVKGDDANGFFKGLISASGKEPSWNFNKYLVSADGTVVKHFPSKVIGKELSQEIDELLAAQ